MARKLSKDERNRKGGKARWKHSTAAERTAFARQGQRAAWQARSPAERAAMIAKMNAARKRKSR